LGSAKNTPHPQRFLVGHFCPAECIYYTSSSLASALPYIVMMMSYFKFFEFCGLLLLPVILMGLWYFARDPRRKHLPPQVPGWPIINQTFLQLKDDPTEILREWARKYGEVFMTKSGSTTFVWLNSMESVKELFDRRSNIYSDRQPMPMALDAARSRYSYHWLTAVAETELRS
jgi:hypothetical protein